MNYYVHEQLWIGTLKERNVFQALSNHLERYANRTVGVSISFFHTWHDSHVFLFSTSPSNPGFESRWNPDFFRLLLSNCLNWKIYCDDHSSLWSTTAVQIYELFHEYFTSVLQNLQTKVISKYIKIFCLFTNDLTTGMESSNEVFQL